MDSCSKTFWKYLKVWDSQRQGITITQSQFAPFALYSVHLVLDSSAPISGPTQAAHLQKVFAFVLDKVFSRKPSQELMFGTAEHVIFTSKYMAYRFFNRMWGVIAQVTGACFLHWSLHWSPNGLINPSNAEILRQLCWTATQPTKLQNSVDATCMTAESNI